MQSFEEVQEISDKVKDFIQHHLMLNGARGVLVAVSGGPDSVALLDMLARLAAGDNARPPDARNRKRAKNPQPIEPQPIEKDDATAARRELRLCVAHFNHKLRGREADEDAEFVRAIAKRFGLPAIIDSADVRAAAESSGRNVEEVGREIRYDFLLAAARESGCDRIATGHTMSDQAETFLIRLARGAGSRGLAAMRPVTLAHVFLGQGPGARGQGPVIDSAPQAQDDASRTKKNEAGKNESRKNESRRNASKRNEMRRIDHQEASQLRHPAPVTRPLTSRPLTSRPLTSRPLLIRPLLCITREEVEQYCRERGLEFRVDSSNEKVDYARNRVRHQVLPALRAVNPRAVEQIARAAQIIAGDQDALDALASEFLDQARVERAKFAPDTGYGKAAGLAYSARALLEQPVALRRRMILEAIRRERAESRSVPGSIRAQITSKHVKAVEGLLKDRMSGSRVTLPGGLEVWREFDALVFKPSASRAGLPEKSVYERELNRHHPRAEAAGFAFTLLRDQPQGLLAASLEQAKREKKRLGQDWMMAVLDDRALPEQLVIRPRHPGERAQVLGQGQTKKLKNLMIDHKIPSSRRFLWPVVVTPDGRYVWSPGLPPAAEFAAHDETYGLAILRASSI